MDKMVLMCQASDHLISKIPQYHTLKTEMQICGKQLLIQHYLLILVKSLLKVAVISVIIFGCYSSMLCLLFYF